MGSHLSLTIILVTLLLDILIFGTAQIISYHRDAELNPHRKEAARRAQRNRSDR